MEAEKFDCWAIVEVMGHSRYAGRVTEQSVGGCNFVRVDIPELPAENGNSQQPAFTKLLGQSSIFCITPVTEEIARYTARNIRAAPVHVYDLPRPHEAQRALPIGCDLDDEEDMPL